MPPARQRAVCALCVCDRGTACVRDPLHYGGRGKECKLCSEAGDIGATLGLAIGGFAFAVIVAVLVVRFCKKHAVRLLIKGKEMMASIRDLDTVIEIESSTRGVATTRSGRCLQLLGNVGVKARILISFFQVLAEIGSVYKIRFPSAFSQMLENIGGLVNTDFGVLPFGCVFPKYSGGIQTRAAGFMPFRTV